MVTLIPASKLEPQWHDVELATQVTIRLKIKRPTPRQVLDELASKTGEGTSDYTLRRISLLIVDWDGVLEEATGQPVPYSFDNLVHLLTQIPSSIWAVSNLISNVMHGIPETERKNSPTPPANGGTTTHDDPQTSSGSSDYQTSASAANQSAITTD